MGLKILAVDDSELIQTMYRILLERGRGHNVIGAANGKEALELLEEHCAVDLIILDLNMPVMGGIEFMKTFGEIGSYKGIPIIVVSTEGGEMDTKKAMDMGAAGYVVKPFRSAKLLSTIDNVLNNNKEVITT